MLLDALAQKLGASEAALRLLLGILAGYPISAIYCLTLKNNTNVHLKHAYFTLSGLTIGYFNYGSDLSHSITAVIFSYVVLHALQNRSANLMLALHWIFHMGYLLVGYYYTDNKNYDISWTMPHCVLVLRLIGLAFDVSDGKKKTEELSRDQRDSALPSAPGLLELSTYVFFPSAFLVGPQFHIKRLRSFINGDFSQFEGSTRCGIARFLLGAAYMLFWHIGSGYVPNEFFISNTFFAHSFALKLMYVALWGKLTLCKYVACWLLSEGALMCLGFTYNGQDSAGQIDWHGCTNVRVKLLESENTMQHYVQAFNVNTNQWVSNYVYKRLKFLNNRTISYGVALLFLAVWHGFHDGYYMAFFIEYMIVSTEKQVERVYGDVVLRKFGHALENSLLYKCLKFLILRAYNYVYMGWCLTPFILLSHDRWRLTFAAVYYYGFVYCGIWFVIYRVYLLQKSTKERSNVAHKRDLTKVD